MTWIAYVMDVLIEEISDLKPSDEAFYPKERAA
jgi:hypothetical protein